MKGNCELCKSQARIYCESDQARLCWSCDAKVHSANFLVAKHSRCLLCHVCQLPTAWSACGEKLGRTVSVCESCVNGCDGVKDSRCRGEEEGGNNEEMESQGDYDADEYDDNDDDDDDDDIDDEEEEEVDSDDEDGENQVVPLSTTSPPPSPSSSSSGDGDCRSRFCITDDVSSKRAPDNFADLCSDDDLECSSSKLLHRRSSPADPFPYRSTEADVDSSSMRPLKVRKVEANALFNIQHKPGTLISSSLMESLNRLHSEDIKSSENSSEAICRSNENSVGFGLLRAL